MQAKKTAIALMSSFPTFEAFQARWYHIPRHRDINPSFPPLYNTYCGLQEGQLCNPPLQEKNSDVVDFSPLSHPLKDNHRFDSDSRCGHTLTDYENICLVPQGDGMAQLDIDSGKRSATVQKGVSTSSEHWIGLGRNAFEGSLQPPELVNRYSDFLTKPMKYGEEQHTGDLLLTSNLSAAQLLAEAEADLTEQGNEHFGSVHGNTIAPKQTSTIDKKEMRARRNRESARRSRLKSKQRFQRMEQTFVLMRRENRALLVLVENLLPNYTARFPLLAGKLQSLFE